MSFVNFEKERTKYILVSYLLYLLLGEGTLVSVRSKRPYLSHLNLTLNLNNNLGTLSSKQLEIFEFFFDDLDNTKSEWPYLVTANVHCNYSGPHPNVMHDPVANSCTHSATLGSQCLISILQTEKKRTPFST